MHYYKWTDAPPRFDPRSGGDMNYIGANGTQVSGGMDYGSGLGVIPQSSLAGLNGMGLAGDQMTNNFRHGGNGQEQQMAAMMAHQHALGQQEAENAAAAAQAAANANAAAAAAAAKAKGDKIRNFVLVGGVLLGAYYLFAKRRNAGERPSNDLEI